MPKFRLPSTVAALLALSLAGSVATAHELRIDCAKTIGTIRPLHGVNGGPVNAGGTVDLRSAWRELKIPLARLHDCEWPSGRVVDMHSVFPSLSADPLRPESYRFRETDDYLSEVLSTGAKVAYRLGESIEHTKSKHHVHPPADYEKWTEAALGVIRHYNEGWAGGFQHNIEYWEIWNEPENRPACWTGSDDDYSRLYRTAASAIKEKYPRLKVGGPAVGASGDLVDGRYQPTEFMQRFLKNCREHRAPLDFFSWHTYTNDPTLLARKAAGIRAWLDAEGFSETELHLNEWNYLPGNDWSALSPGQPGSRRRAWYEQLNGPEGAAFVAYALCDLQDSPLDAANYFHGDSSPFGLFNQYGERKKTFYAMQAFAWLLETPNRLAVTGGVEGEVIACAGVNEVKDQIGILVSNFRGDEGRLDLRIANLPWKGGTVVEQFRLDRDRDLQLVTTDEWHTAPEQFAVEFTPPCAIFVRLSKAKVK